MELTFGNIVRINLLAGVLEYVMHVLLFRTLMGGRGNKKRTCLLVFGYEFVFSLVSSSFFYYGFFRRQAMLVLYYYILAGIWAVWIRFVYKARWRDSIVISAVAEFFYICAENMTGFITLHNYDLTVPWELICYVAVDWFGGAIAAGVMVLLLKHTGIDQMLPYFLYDAGKKKWWRAAAFLLPGLPLVSIYLVNERRLLHNNNPMTVLLCLLLVYSVFNYGMQKKQVEQQKLSIRQQELYICSLERVHRDMRMFRHDYKNMMSGVYVQAGEGNLEAVQEFVSGMMDTFEQQVGDQIQQITQLGNIRNLEIRGVFAAKAARAQSRRVRCELEVMTPIEKVHVSDWDFCRMAGILLDNALEAVEGTERPFFSVMLSQNEQCTTLRVKNPVSDEVPSNDIWLEGYSTKGEGRGMGLVSLRRIIESYEHVFLFSNCENGEFIQEIKIQEG